MEVWGGILFCISINVSGFSCQVLQVRKSLTHSRQDLTLAI